MTMSVSVRSLCLKNLCAYGSLSEIMNFIKENVIGTLIHGMHTLIYCY